MTRYFCELTTHKGKKFTFAARTLCQAQKEAERYRRLLGLPANAPCRIKDHKDKVEFRII